jgi:hypothetical protein
MSLVIMLDLQGTLIATEEELVGVKDKYGVRPNSRQFISEILKLTDEVYLNTHGSEEDSLGIMFELFDTIAIRYHQWDRASPFGKAEGYDEFSGSTLIHVEDMQLKVPAIDRINELGHHLIQVPTWTTDTIYQTEDKALVEALDKIRGIVG